MRKALVGFFWLVAASCALAQGVPGLAIPSGLFASAIQLVGAFNPSDVGSGVALSNNNRTMAVAGGSVGSVRLTTSESSGKWYFESTGGATFSGIGLANSSAPLTQFYSTAGGLGYNGSGQIQFSNAVLTTVSGYTTTDVIGIAVDFSVPNVSFYKNNTLLYTSTSVPTGALYIAAVAVSGGAVTLNLDPVYPIPSGYVLWGN